METRTRSIIKVFHLGIFPVVTILLGNATVHNAVFAASTPAPSLVKAMKDSESKGFIFESSHDAIVDRARKEGKVRVLSGLDQEANTVIREAFKKKYPFIDLYVEEIPVEAAQRLLLEMKTGKATGWDANHLAIDLYPEYVPYQKRFDILGMAREKLLNIPLDMIDPVHRNIVALGSDIQVIAYNTKLMPAERVPGKWEDFLKPEFKGRKFVADIRTTAIASFVPLWGLEKTMDFARKIAAQQPIWARGYTRVAAGIVAGEYALFFGPTFGSVKRAQAKDAPAAWASRSSIQCRLALVMPTRSRTKLNTLMAPCFGLSFRPVRKLRRYWTNPYPLARRCFPPQLYKRN
jgi:Bacterial extracellular solute-binding protein